MSDVYGADDIPVTPTVGQAPSEPTVDPARLAGYLSTHRGAEKAAKGDYDSIMARRQSAVDEARAALDKTISELRAKHEGSGFGQVNLPLLSLAAGLLNPGPPGTVSNFGAELGRGLGAMGTTIRSQRMNDTEFLKGIAELQQKSSALSDIPLKDAAAAAKARELAEISAQRAGEVAGLRVDKEIVVPATGEVIYTDPKTGQRMIRSADGKTVRPLAGGATGAAVPTPGGEPVAPEEAVNVLKQTSPDIGPHTTDVQMNWPKLAEIAKQDPQKAQVLWKKLMYEADPFGTINTRGGPLTARQKQEALDELQQIDPTYSRDEFLNAQKTRVAKWTGQNTKAIQFDTGLGHMDQLLGAYAALGNGNSQPLNDLTNKFKQMMGNANLSDQAVTAKFVGDEMATYLASGQGSALGDRQALEHLLAGKLTPDAALRTIQRMSTLMREKADSLAHAKQQDLGNKRKYGFDNYVSPQAQEHYKNVQVATVAKVGGKPMILQPGKTQRSGMTYQGGDPSSPDSWK